MLEAFPVGGGGTGVALVDVDHVDPPGGPAERDGPAAPGCGDLSCGIGRVHGGRASCSAGGAVRAWASVICASTATIWGTTAAGSSDVQAGELAPPSWSGAGNDGLRADRDGPACGVTAAGGPPCSGAAAGRAAHAA